MFSYKKAIEFPKNIDINKFIIKLVNQKQSVYEFIYISSLIELKILKNYIKSYLKIDFI